MRLMIAAGGTGGHIYPGIAVANEIKRRDSSAEVLFVGTEKGLETRIVPESGYGLAVISSSGLKNVGLKGQIRGLWILPRSFMQAAKIIRSFRPNVVVGAGGYVSGPVLMTAKLLGCPTLVMDSNALPGFTNRRLARFVDRAALTFEAAKPFFGDKGVVTGNPVRSEFFRIPERTPSKPLNVLIFGGSQGAQAINRAVLSALPLLPTEDLTFVHQTGEAMLDEVRETYAKFHWTADIRPYIRDMVGAFKEADIIICRAGATTCAEVAAAGKASIMIPLPTAADDHQRKNAEAMVQAGAARMLLQAELTGERLANELLGLAKDTASITAIGRAARAMAKPNAAQATADIIEELAARG
jgi:UDP-N-acetylglucosamine--N-acetylmuramyl-(pentapeptide) pyrophosphoryl-undecaprenol N-acetylglucosamine transferase